MQFIISLTQWSGFRILGGWFLPLSRKLNSILEPRGTLTMILLVLVGAAVVFFADAFVTVSVKERAWTKVIGWILRFFSGWTLIYFFSEAFDEMELVKPELVCLLGVTFVLYTLNALLSGLAGEWQRILYLPVNALACLLQGEVWADAIYNVLFYIIGVILIRWVIISIQKDEKTIREAAQNLVEQVYHRTLIHDAAVSPSKDQSPDEDSYLMANAIRLRFIDLLMEYNSEKPDGYTNTRPELEKMMPQAVKKAQILLVIHMSQRLSEATKNPKEAGFPELSDTLTKIDAKQRIVNVPLTANTPGDIYKATVIQWGESPDEKVAAELDRKMRAALDEGLRLFVYSFRTNWAEQHPDEEVPEDDELHPEEWPEDEPSEPISEESEPMSEEDARRSGQTSAADDDITP